MYSISKEISNQSESQMTKKTIRTCPVKQSFIKRQPNVMRYNLEKYPPEQGLVLEPCRGHLKVLKISYCPVNKLPVRKRPICLRRCPVIFGDHS